MYQKTNQKSAFIIALLVHNPMVSYSTFFQANATERMQTHQNWSRIGKISQSNANAGQMSRTGFSVNCANGGPMLELLTNALKSITNQASL